jgi:hypothetical protein
VALFNEDKKIAILANKETTAIGILKGIKLAYENLPKFLQQGIVKGGWNKKTIEFENGTSLLASSTSSSALRGYSANVLLLDEFAFVPPNIASEFMSSVYPIIMSGETTKIIIVSTPNGSTGHFFDIYKCAQLPRSDARANNFYPIYIGWKDVPGRDDKWRDNVIRDIGMMKWLQEFDCQFLGSTATLVDGNKLSSICTMEPIEITSNGSMFIYEHPIPGKTYIIGADPCKGLGQDFATMQVLRVDGLEKFEQVAVFRNSKIDPHTFSGELIRVSKMYNEAALLVENNGKEGGMVIEAIRWTYQYDRLISASDVDLGISSNVKVKFIANMNMRRYVENNFIILHDKQTILELGKYEEVKPNIFRSKNRDEHDDCVTSLIWALYAIEILPLMDMTFDPDTKMLISSDYNNSKYESDNSPIAVIDDGSDFVEQWIEDGAVWNFYK